MFCINDRYTLQRLDRQNPLSRSFEISRASGSLALVDRYPLQTEWAGAGKKRCHTDMQCTNHRYTVQQPHRQNPASRSFEIAEKNDFSPCVVILCRKSRYTLQKSAI
jgi:hypothetical protein